MKDWLIMADLKEKDFNNVSWLPVYSYTEEKNDLKTFQDGYKSEVTILRGVLIKPNQEKYISLLNYNDILHYQNEERWLSRDYKYFKTDDFSPEEKKIKGEFLVFKRLHPTTHEMEILISYDFINALGLYKINNNYCNPLRNDEIVVKTEWDNVHHTFSVLIKKEYLMDYLSARKMSMLFEVFIERQYKSLTSLPITNFNENTSNYCYELYSSQTLPNGMRPNESAMVIKAVYNDVNPNIDVPVFDRENMTVTNEELKTPNGPIINNYFANFRKFFVLENNNYSEIIWHDKSKAIFDYYIDNSNKKVITKKLEDKIQFLWFKPDVIKKLLEEKYTSIKWRTANIATIYFGNDYFDIGLNKEGLVNVFITDVIKLDSYYQRIWHAYNCSPSGGVSNELLAVEIACKTVNTTAPEELLDYAIEELNSSYNKKYGEYVFKQSDSKLSKSKINRFVSISKSDCFTLCKNLNIYVTERFDLEVLKKQTSNADKKLGSLKRLELLLSQKDGNVHNIISPLFIIYDMRIVDSHDVNEDNSVFDRLGIKLTGNEENYVVIGATIIYLLAKCLHELAEIINK